MLQKEPSLLEVSQDHRGQRVAQGPCEHSEATLSNKGGLCADNPGSVLIYNGYGYESILRVDSHVLQHILWAGGGLSLDHHDPTDAVPRCIQLRVVEDDLHQMRKMDSGIAFQRSQRGVSLVPNLSKRASQLQESKHLVPSLVSAIGQNSKRLKSYLGTRGESFSVCLHGTYRSQQPSLAYSGPFASFRCRPSRAGTIG